MESEISINALLSEFGTRLNELEEKQRLIKDRLLLVGENLVSTRDEYDKKELEFRKKINEMDYEVRVLKQLVKRIVNELENFTRKEESIILEKQFKMFQPLQFARIEDVKEIVEKYISELNKTEKNKSIKNKEN